MGAIESLTKEMTKPKVQPLQEMIQQSVKELGRALPAHLGPDRLVRIALTCIRLNPALASCSPESFMGALFTLAQLGLEPIAGRAYLLPFKNKRKIGNKWETFAEVQAIVGYKGLVDLFYRHEKAVMLTWGIVHEGDDFDYSKGTEHFLRHKPSQKKRGEILGYWVAAKLQNGGNPFEYMSKDDCMVHGQKHSKTWITKEWNDSAKSMVECTPHFSPSSPWAKEPESMCLKTVLIQLAKLLPLSMELQQAIANDETSRDYRRGVSDVLDIPSTTEWTETATETVKSEAPAQLPEDGEISQESTPASDETRFITAKQRGLVHMKFKATGHPETVLRDYLNDSFGKESTSAIPADKMDSVLKWIEGLKA